MMLSVCLVLFLLSSADKASESARLDELLTAYPTCNWCTCTWGLVHALWL